MLLLLLFINLPFTLTYSACHLFITFTTPNDDSFNRHYYNNNNNQLVSIK